ncbi:MAG: hypothetical protein Kow00128_06190 [Deltaproteobacteria bacterium]
MRTAALFLAMALLGVPCPASAKGPGLRVLASFLPIYLFARNVAGNAPGVDVEMMLPAQLGCPHDYALTPGDMRKIARADLFLANGRGMEDFLGAPVRRVNPSIRVVETAAGVPPSPDDNPHTWVSPRNAILQVRAIERALAEASPGNAPLFRRNADAYIRRLAALTREFEEAAPRFRNRKIVTFHNVFDYLARDLGLTVVGRVEETAGQSPSAGEMAALIRTIRDTGAAAIFAEPQYPRRLAETIGREAGVPVRTLDPVATGSVSPTTYEEAMRKNLSVLTEVLSAR